MAELSPAVADPLAFVIGSRCDTDTAAAYGSSGTPLGLDVAALLREAGQLECQQRPATAPDAVRWCESTMSPLELGVGDVSATAQLLVPGQQLLVEVSRLFASAGALAVVETVATYLRVTVYEAGDTVATVYADAGTTARPSSATEPVSVIADPFVPAAGTGLRAPPLVGPRPAPVRWGVEWSLRVVGVPSRSPGNTVPRIIGPANSGPSGADLCAPWGDNRRAWGNRYSERHRWLVDGPQLVQLFATVRAPQPPAGVDGSTLLVAGRLAGWTQAAGWRSTALDTATSRT